MATKKFEARIIGETSGVMTGLEIYIDGELCWSRSYFASGATGAWYRQGMRQSYDDAMACETVENWAEHERDDNGELIIEALDVHDTTWIVATYRPEVGWHYNTPRNDGQSRDWIKANADRIPDTVVAAWEV
jgi:hypothetical protein